MLSIEGFDTRFSVHFFTPCFACRAGTSSMMSTYLFHIVALAVWWVFLIDAFFHGTGTPYLAALHDVASAALASVTAVIPEAIVHTACLLLGWLSACDLYSVKALISALLMVAGVLAGTVVDNKDSRSVLMSIGAGGAVGIRLQAYGIYGEWKLKKLNNEEPRLHFDHQLCAWFLAVSLVLGFAANILFSVCVIKVPANSSHDYLLSCVLWCAIAAELGVAAYVFRHRSKTEEDKRSGKKEEEKEHVSVSDA